MRINIVLSAIDKAAILLIGGALLAMLFSYMIGSAKFTKLFGILFFVATSAFLAIAAYVHLKHS